MTRGISWAGTLALLGAWYALAACGGDEFSSGETGGAGGSGGAAGSGTGGSAGSGGAAGTGVGGSGGSSGAAGNGGSSGVGGSGGSAGSTTGGAGGTAGAAGSSGAGGTGGTGGVAGCGPVPGMGLALYSTLDAANEITPPTQGNPANAAFDPPDFHGGTCGAAIQIDAENEYIQFAEAQNILYTKGTLDFWFRPQYQEFDGLAHTFLESSGFGTKAGIQVKKLGTTNALAVVFTDTSAVQHETRVSDAQFNFKIGVWIRITVTWDFSAGVTQAVRVYFDGVEPSSYTKTVPGGANVSINTQDNLLYVGNASPTGNSPAGGLLDDLKIYASVVPP